MQIRELSKPITAKQLNENLAKQFGYKINFEQFSDVQLEDARNKLRTKISQFEVNEGYDALHDSQDYHKTRMFLDCINQEILEREETKETTVETKEPKKMKKETKKEAKVESWVPGTIRQRARSLSVPMSWIDSAIQRISLRESDREELKAELTLRYDLKESQAGWILLEGEEDKAKTIMATKDMVDRITGWLEDTAAMKAEQLLELMDSIRETMGSDVAQQYQEQVKPALEAVYTALETSRQGLQGALALVSGGEAPTMGAEPAMGAAPGGMAGGLPSMSGDEEGALPGEETPPAPETERIKRESVDYSRRLGQLLAQSKKK